jgi:hypothetical protein
MNVKLKTKTMKENKIFTDIFEGFNKSQKLAREVNEESEKELKELQNKLMEFPELETEKDCLNAPNVRLYNFLKDDLKKLQQDIKKNNTEEIDNFFSYWEQHLEGLLTKTK